MLQLWKGRRASNAMQSAAFLGKSLQMITKCSRIHLPLEKDAGTTDVAAGVVRLTHILTHIWHRLVQWPTKRYSQSFNSSVAAQQMQVAGSGHPACAQNSFAEGRVDLSRCGFPWVLAGSVRFS